MRSRPATNRQLLNRRHKEMNAELQKKVDRAVKLLRLAEHEAKTFDQPVEVCYSGGKDSDVLLHLTRLSGIQYRAIYKNTTIDPPGTIAHVKANGVEVMRPKKDFFTLVKEKGMPTRRVRHCCEKLKEYKILEVAVQGVRTAESSARAERYSKPQFCRMYNATDHVSVYLPVMDWTDRDVAEYIEAEGIKCHPLYYDEQGCFHVERRLGCMGCPMPNHRGRPDFKAHPQLVKAWIRAAQVWMQRPTLQSADKFQRDACHLFFNNVFCESYEEYHDRVTPDIFGQYIDPKTFLEDYFKVNICSHDETKCNHNA